MSGPFPNNNANNGDNSSTGFSSMFPDFNPSAFNNPFSAQGFSPVNNSQSATVATASQG